ncbi:hypothetical protein AVEN_167071-1 [Araneus ventricosus]|uniref:Uncharacterized protein n=1 Tax=Araneus ventricosus TaxID=182803 RepID=A0A4Y2CP32_ARAVE|nr:hypothetical protein AVEN_167071-1 [Araneus ventricosus]
MSKYHNTQEKSQAEFERLRIDLEKYKDKYEKAILEAERNGQQKDLLGAEIQKLQSEIERIRLEKESLAERKP